ncbi:class II fructose-bisphosphate aldolase [Candidatus Peregrinibacteria bacterium]|nr:class II fructose-bisphosphate aldolase [Candidatus Peregrinibacteria bacterium]
MTDISPCADFSPAHNPHVRVFSDGSFFYNLRELLAPALQNHFGVPAINCRSRHIVIAVLTAAWEEKSPIILEIAESEQKYCNMPPERLADMVHAEVNAMIERYGYHVPVCLHMDHVQKDLTLIDRAITAGFSSVEADLSKLPLAENIAKSREVVKKAHSFGVSVELEEGEIGATSALVDPNIDANIESYYTKAEDAARLAKEGGADAIAIFVGNGHGQYLKEPKIGFDRIREVASAAGIPVVLHGGSGLKPEVFRRAIECGAAKFNYATSVSDVLFENLPAEFLGHMDAKAKELNTARRKVLYLFEEKIDALPAEILSKARKAMEDHVRMMMREAFLSVGQAKFYEKKAAMAACH